VGLLFQGKENWLAGQSSNKPWRRTQPRRCIGCTSPHAQNRQVVANQPAKRSWSPGPPTPCSCVQGRSSTTNRRYSRPRLPNCSILCGGFASYPPGSPGCETLVCGNKRIARTTRADPATPRLDPCSIYSVDYVPMHSLSTYFL
jgi:hypothetical protein